MSGPPTLPLPAVTAVLFDIDNTLIPTHRIWLSALHTAASDLAREHPGVCAGDIADSYTRTSDRLWGDYNRALAPIGSHTAARRRVWNVALREAGIELTGQQLNSHVHDFARQQMRAIRPDPAVARLFRRLAAHFQLGAITDGDTLHQHTKLEHASLDGYFETVVCALGNGRRKPDPAPFHQACKDLAVPPEQCLYVGDEWDTDILGASAAGMHPVWINPSAERPPAGAPPTISFPSLTACLTALCDHAARPPIDETEREPT